MTPPPDICTHHLQALRKRRTAGRPPVGSAVRVRQPVYYRKAHAPENPNTQATRPYAGQYGLVVASTGCYPAVRVRLLSGATAVFFADELLRVSAKAYQDALTQHTQATTPHMAPLPPNPPHKTWTAAELRAALPPVPLAVLSKFAHNINRPGWASVHTLANELSYWFDELYPVDIREALLALIDAGYILTTPSPKRTVLTDYAPAANIKSLNF